MSDSDTYLSSNTSDENSDGTVMNESDKMSEKMEVFVQVQPFQVTSTDLGCVSLGKSKSRFLNPTTDFVSFLKSENALII